MLVLIIFAWTPPHFWALCIHRKDEYAKADIPMLPVTHGERYTKLHILLYTLVLFAVSLMPFVIHMSGLVYLLCALALGARFLDWAWALYCDSRPTCGDKDLQVLYRLPVPAVHGAAGGPLSAAEAASLIPL